MAKELTIIEGFYHWGIDLRGFSLVLETYSSCVLQHHAHDQEDFLE